MRARASTALLKMRCVRRWRGQLKGTGLKRGGAGASEQFGEAVEVKLLHPRASVVQGDAARGPAVFRSPACPSRVSQPPPVSLGAVNTPYSGLKKAPPAHSRWPISLKAVRMSERLGRRRSLPTPRS
jgi:hypothetical protein